MPRVARVAVDIPLAHVDRLFDYEIPDSLVEIAQPGVRVKVSFGGSMKDGWIIELADHTEAPKLVKLKKVVSPERVVDDKLYQLIRAVADHYAGSWWDVARLAIPPRHATTEKAPQRSWPEPTIDLQPVALPSYPAGESFLTALQEGRSPRALWHAAAVDASVGDLIAGTLEAMAATLASGRSVIAIAPTARMLTQLTEQAKATFGKTAVAVLSADSGRYVAARYRAFLAALRGEAKIVVGTRSAVFAPVHNLGLIVVLDDGNNAHTELRAPHPHTRSVAVLRCAQQSAGLLLAGHSRSLAAEGLVQRGWLKAISLEPAQARRLQPLVRVVDEFDRQRDPVAARLRLPSAAFRFLRDHLPQGPVLVQVPMVGDSASLACARCRNLARCSQCHGPMRARAKGTPECSLCGYQPARWRCPHCHTDRLRTPLAGASRTAEELARAFPGVLAVNSSGDHIRDEVPNEPAIVVATPGAEPQVAGGYAAALLLDGEVMLHRATLTAAEEAVRRWSNAIAKVRAPHDGGSVLMVAPVEHPAVQSLIKADGAGFAANELEMRRLAGLPPAMKVARITGDAEAVREFLDNDDWGEVEILGPTETLSGTWAALLRIPITQAKELPKRVKSAAAIRSARKEPGRLSIYVDPESLEDR